MSEFINTIDVLGDNQVIDSIIKGTITEFMDDVIINVGRFAFSDKDKLTSVDLPLATSIGGYAFNECSSLTNVGLPLITNIDIATFMNCTSLTSVDFPLVTSIGGSAFSGCTSLTSVDFPLVTSIGSSAFSGCINLTSVDFPLVTDVAKGSFQKCSSLTSVSLPLITVVDNNAFQSCSNLTNVDFPSVTSIDTYAFSGCTSLTSVDFPLVTRISDYAFSYCSNLTSISSPSVANIGTGVFGSCINLTDADFPLVTSTGTSAFLGCTSLINVDLPLLTSIAYGVFQDCSSLTKIDFPLVTSLGSYAFRNCTQLTTVDFPLATSIGSSAFYGCTQLITLILRSETTCTLSYTNAFTSTPIASGTGYIYVPSALVDSYKTATNWSTYAAQFRALEDYTVDGTITGELDPDKVNPREPMELTDDWSTIMTACNDGTYSTKYKVGDWKPLDLGSEGTVNMQIVAKDTDTLADGSGTAAVTWIAKELLATKHRMNPSSSYTTLDDGTKVYTEGTGAIGGWEKSELRSYMRDDIYHLIVDDVRANIVEVKKRHSASNTSAETIEQETVDSIWIPSELEVASNYASTPTVYESVYYDDNSRIKCLQDGSTFLWYLRDLSGYKTSTAISKTGSASSMTDTFMEYGIALGFCAGVTK